MYCSVWQAAAPAYAQATLSLWSELLFDGHLVDAPPESGGMPSPSLSQSCGYSFCDYQPLAPGQSWWYPQLTEQYWPEPKTYRLWGGHGQGLVIVARKHETRNQFVLVGTVQPQSNVVGNAPLNVTATIMLEGVRLTFTVRRQGSVYLYSPSSSGALVQVDPQAEVAPPSFVQLDGWHESSHFSWWSNDFEIEAELHTAFQPSDALAGTVQTELRAWREGDCTHDFTTARAFVSLGGTDTGTLARQSFAYEFEPRAVSRNELIERTADFRTYRLEIVMRRKRSAFKPSAANSSVQPTAPADRGCVVLRLEAVNTSESASGTTSSGTRMHTAVACVEGSEWQNVRVENPHRLETARAHRLVMEVASANDAVDVDKLRLVEVDTY